MADERLAAAIADETSARLDASLVKIRHCVVQLTDEQLWWRPKPSMNSVANLLLHLSGNLRQWIVAGVGDAADVRDRPSEFSERGPIPREELLTLLEDTISDAKRVMSEVNAEDLLRPRRIQGFELTALGAVFDSIPHLGGHVQEIVNLTRQQLGEAYRFEWSPLTTEEGA
tara:strand:+ start:265 stop:777 length:513 start_codon:yes stop_codon:yes gene_type:complete